MAKAKVVDIRNRFKERVPCFLDNNMESQADQISGPAKIIDIGTLYSRIYRSIEKHDAAIRKERQRTSEK